MKKVLSIVALAALVTLGTSCGKKYDCTCSESNGTTTVTQVKGANKDAAQVSCVAKSNTSTGKACAIIN